MQLNPDMGIYVNNKLLLTDTNRTRGPYSGQYWSEVVTVRTEHSVQKRPRANIPQSDLSIKLG